MAGRERDTGVRPSSAASSRARVIASDWMPTAGLRLKARPRRSRGRSFADPRDGGQALVVRVTGEKLDGPRLDLAALSNQTAPFGQHEAEHANGIGARVDGQSRGANRCGVTI